MIAKTDSYAGCKVLSVGGRIDFESALEFEQHVNAMLREASEYYIIELSKVELLSSAGLRVMLSTAKRVAQRNAALALAAPSAVVRQVFEISHFNLLFKIFNSVPEAITAIKGSAPAPGPYGQWTPIVEPAAAAPVQPAPPRTVSPAPRRQPPEPEPADTESKPREPAERPVRAEAPVLPRRPASSFQAPAAPPAPPVPPPPISSEEEDESLPPPMPVTRPAVDLSGAGAATVTPPAFNEEKLLISQVPPDQKESSSAQTQPPPLPGKQSIPVPPPVRPAIPVARREAKYPARLEVRAEGTSYPCKDGDVIGSEGKLAQPFFSQVTNLAPRHLLIGQLEGRWFVFTPKNVQHPFTLDGVPLRPGERKMLQYVEHQVEFSGHVFGFRLVPEQGKEGLFSRVFGGKR